MDCLCTSRFVRISRSHGIALACLVEKVVRQLASQPGLQIYSARPLANNQTTLALVLVVMMTAVVVMMMNR